MLRDKVTQENREVDVLVTARTANYKVAIGIEVVSWSRPAGTPWVERMRAKHDNLEIDKLILVSQSGFTKPAIVKASFYGIETLTVERAIATDWPLLASLESNGVFAVTTLRYDCTFVCAFEDGTKEQIEAPLQSTISYGDQTLTLDEFVRKLVDRAEFRDALYPHIKGAGEHSFSLAYTEPDGLWKIVNNGRSGQVEELRIGLRVLHSKTPVQLASGMYTEVPFVAGISQPETPPLQFVLAKKADGAVSGVLIDREGIRSLSSFQT
ncbi:MAG: restriction endonuclease [Nitrosomonadales bacterium]|nr:restriction endonuclease [Nitrosomonadales bacterium]